MSENKINTGDDSAAQRNRLLTALRKGPVTTLQARAELDVLHPAGRVQELRHKGGFNIVTQWHSEETIPGHRHRVAMYILCPGQWKGGAL